MRLRGIGLTTGEYSMYRIMIPYTQRGLGSMYVRYGRLFDSKKAAAKTLARHNHAELLDDLGHLVAFTRLASRKIQKDSNLRVIATVGKYAVVEIIS